MARIDLFPVLVGEHALDDLEEGARLKQTIQDSATAMKRLVPVMDALVASNDVAIDTNRLTDANVDDLVVTLRPFMDMPEDEARYTLSQTSVTEWLDAFIRVGPMVEQAVLDTSMLGKNLAGGA